ncbi:MAG: molybdopterin biosynthesis protein [Methanothrix sp.]|nr:MAG: molybdopterin biosynthesis protein [Methanothrix sp.]
MPKEFRTLIPLEEARSIVLSHAPRPGMEAVRLPEAAGRVLAERIVSGMDVPGFARASMDGFAVQSEDTLDAREDRPIPLKLVGSVPMGAKPEVRVGRGEVAEVSTGSMMPPGADAVVMIEYSQAEGDRVLVRRPVYGSENVQAAGSDISLGEVVLFPGTRLAAREIGVLAALGRETVPVRRLRVGVASTGNELIRPGCPLGLGQIYDINSYTVAVAVQDCGATAIRYGILPDVQEEMARVLQKMASECDLILVSGSTSAGAGDMVYKVLDNVGETIFHGVNLKPGKPTIFGLIDGKPCLGLPGYPTSALTVFGELAAPFIRQSLGTKAHGYVTKGQLAGPIRTEGRQQMLAVGISRGQVYTVDKGSGSITTLAGADGVMEIPSGIEYLEKGTAVDLNLFSELEVPDLVVAGENSAIVEKLAEKLPLQIRLMNTGSLRGRMYLGDGVADLACVSGLAEAPAGTVLVKGYKRELGLIYRDESALQNLARSRIVGWHRDFALKAAFERILSDLGLSHPKYVRAAKTHSSVAAAIAAGWADMGFGERGAAEDAGLRFKPVMNDEILFLARSGWLEDQAAKSFISALRDLSRD